jgi:chromosome segregation ATPase
MKHHVCELKSRDKSFHCKIKELEETHSAALSKQKSLIEQLQSELKAANHNCVIALQEAKVSFNDKADQLEIKREKEVKELQGRVYKLEEDVASSSKIFQELLDQQEEEYELMISQLKLKSDIHSQKEQQVKDDIIASFQSIKIERDQLVRQVEELKSKLLFSDESFKRELSLRRNLEEEKVGLNHTVSDLSTRIESETLRVHELEKDLQSSEAVQRKLKEELHNTENSNAAIETEIKKSEDADICF